MKFFVVTLTLCLLCEAHDLLTAILKNDRATAERLLTNMGSEINVGENGVTPLHMATQLGRVEMVKLLLSHPTIDINVVDENGDAPVHVATQQNHKSVLELLLDDPRLDFERQNLDGLTALDLGSSIGVSKDILTLLKGAVADIERRKNQ